MPTLQQIAAQIAPTNGRRPPATVPTAPVAPEAEALLPEAQLESPLSAQQAIDRLARQRFGDSFVEEYGDVLGVRQKSFSDRLRNVAQILATGNPAAAQQLAFQGAQARANLERGLMEQAAAQRKEMMNLLQFVPNAIKAKMPAKIIRQLFSEQFMALTGQEPHGGVIDALVEMEKQGERPIAHLQDDLVRNRLSLDQFRALGSDLTAFSQAIAGLQRMKNEERAADLAADEKYRQSQAVRELSQLAETPGVEAGEFAPGLFRAGQPSLALQSLGLGGAKPRAGVSGALERTAERMTGKPVGDPETDRALLQLQAQQEQLRTLARKEVELSPDIVEKEARAEATKAGVKKIVTQAAEAEQETRLARELITEIRGAVERQFSATSYLGRGRQGLVFSAARQSPAMIQQLYPDMDQQTFDDIETVYSTPAQAGSILKGMRGDTGRLSDFDIQRITRALPKIWDARPVALAKLRVFERVINAVSDPSLTDEAVNRLIRRTLIPEMEQLEIEGQREAETRGRGQMPASRQTPSGIPFELVD